MNKVLKACICVCLWVLVCCEYRENDWGAAKSVPTNETDEYLDECWHLESMGCKEMWSWLDESGKLPGEDVVVAVIDTGLDTNCNELQGALWCNEAELNGVPDEDDDGNGYIDDVYGVNLANRYNYMTDTQGHGTQMAGIIAMQPENGGCVGVAYGVKIMPIKASVDTNFDIDTVIEAIHYAVDMGADIINMSFGTYRYSEELEQAVNEAAKSCVLVAAAGNERYVTQGECFGKSELEKEGYKIGNVYPASFSSCIGVMAYDRNGQLADFSNWDQCDGEQRSYDLIAPGQTITTIGKSNEYVTGSGTSQATAMVSGAVAILKSITGDQYSPEQLKALFKEAMSENVEFCFGDKTYYYPKCSIRDLKNYLWEEGIGSDSEKNPTEDNKQEEIPSEDSQIEIPKDQESMNNGINAGEQNKEENVQEQPQQPNENKTAVADNEINSVKEKKIVKQFTVGGINYKVTSPSTVTVVGLKNKKAKKVIIQDKVKKNGRKYKVTAIGKKAFYKCAKAKYIVIGKYVEKIQKKAFYGIQKKALFVVKGTKKHQCKVRKMIKRSMK